jgi:hypothetical protein
VHGIETSAEPAQRYDHLNMMREIALDERRLGAAFVARHHKTYFAITAPSRKEPQLLPLRLSLLSGEVVSRHAKQLLSLWPLLPRASARTGRVDAPESSHCRWLA